MRLRSFLRQGWAVRLAPAIRLGAALSVLCASGSLSCQVFDLSGGASTLYGAQGASVVIHGAETETSLGAGLLAGHFAAGGETVRKISNGTIAAGQQEFCVDVPTDVFDTSHIFFGTGIGLHRNTEAAHSLNAFVGLSSAEAGTPLFQSVDVGRLSGFTQWKQPFGSSCSSVSTVLLASSDSALQSLQCSIGPKAVFAATAGFGNGGRYEAVSARIKQRRLDLRASYVDLDGNFQRGNNLYQLNPEPVRENVSADYHLTRTVIVSGLHQNYMTPFSPSYSSYSAAFTTSIPTGATLWSSLDEASIRYGRSNTGLSLSVLHSTSRQAATSISSAYAGSNVSYFAGLTHSFGRLQWTESLFHSDQQDGNGSTILVNGLAANINSHLRITEAANVTGSGTTFSHGGALITRFSSIEVDYEMLYLASRPSNPFQQAMVFDAQLRLIRSLWVQAGSSISPTGSTLYTFRLGTVFARNAPAPEPISAVGLGINVLRGRVVYPSGDPIEGAALMIGTTRVYTDSQGYFFFREKVAHSHPFRVVLDEFVGMGNFATVSAPNEVRTSTKPDAALVSVVVAHAPETPSQIADITPSLPAKLEGSR